MYNCETILNYSKYESATAARKSLHWLPVRERINFKVLCCVHRCYHQKAPGYLCNMIQGKQNNRTLRSSMDQTLLKIPVCKHKTFGGRAFSTFGSELWNKLPQNVREKEELKDFKKDLKTYLFKRIYT